MLQLIPEYESDSLQPVMISYAHLILSSFATQAIRLFNDTRVIERHISQFSLY